MNRIIIDCNKKEGVISPELHSHFIEFLGACIYDGIWVGEESEIENYGGIRKAAADGQLLNRRLSDGPEAAMRIPITGETVSASGAKGR